MGISDQGSIVEGSGQVKRRHATILFSDISSSTQLAELCDPESLANILDQVGQLVERVSRRYGGVTNQIHGDGALIVFGFPEPQENEALAAISAAIDLHSEVAAMDCHGYLPTSFTLNLHTGVHAGLIVATRGDWMHGRYKLTGDALNTASRLSDAARMGEILVSESTLQSVQPYFEVSARRSLSLKGKRDRVVAHNVLRRSPVQSRYDASVRRGLLPFVARKKELQKLQVLLARTDNHGLQLALVSGNAGVGKTRLIEHFIEQYAADFGIYRINCGLDGSAMALPQLAPGQPVIIFIDDWHWADEQAHSLLQNFMNYAVNNSVLLIIASRALGFGSPLIPDGRLDLEPLEKADSNRMITTFFQKNYSATKADMIYRRSGGNPLFIEELCRQEQCLAGQYLSEPAEPVPAALHGLIESRLEGLPDDYRLMVRAAAVIGNRVPRDVFEQLLGHPLSDQMLLELSQLDFLHSDSPQDDIPQEGCNYLYFKHGLTRDIAYQSLLLDDRKSLHLQVAGILEETSLRYPSADQLESLAYHFSAAQVREKASYYARAASDRRAEEE